MKKLLVLSLSFILISACGTSKQVSVITAATPLQKDAFVEVIGMGQKVSQTSKLLGRVKIVDSGFTAGSNCTYAQVVADAQNQARGMGGDLIQITEHKEPGILTSSCHRIWCDVYKK